MDQYCCNSINNDEDHESSSYQVSLGLRLDMMQRSVRSGVKECDLTRACSILAVFVVLSSVPGAAQVNTTNKTNTTLRIPYIHGRWKLNFKYVEMAGSIGFESGCQGAFPYIYSVEYWVYQYEGQDQYVLCRMGDDCVGNPYTLKTLQQSAFEVYEENCKLRDHGLLESGLNEFLMNQYKRLADLPPIYIPHTNEFEKIYGRPRNEYGEDVQSGTWGRWKVPGQAEVVTRGMSAEERLKVQMNATKQPWGRICDQFDWPDMKELGPGYANSFYEGALRHENMTWIWIKHLSTCRCFPACKDCYYSDPEVSPQFQNINETCIASFGDDIEIDCDYKIVGVGGGPVVYPPNTTGRDLDFEDNPLICWQYSVIEGYRTLEAAKTSIPRGLALTGAASNHGALRVNGMVALALALLLM